jgi:starch phosphorylase
MAKKIISFITALSDMINSDPVASKYLKVVFVEDYNVTKAELLIPSADISEQISLAGTEASGTGNMKFMINGAVTLGTLDGANVEIHEAVGDDNIILFGMKTPEVNELKKAGYHPESFYHNNPRIRKTLDFINSNHISGKSFPEIGETIKHHDPYMVLADFADYALAQAKAEEIFNNKDILNRMSLYNVAGAGIFAADRSINDYARDIWHTVKAAEKK